MTRLSNAELTVILHQLGVGEPNSPSGSADLLPLDPQLRNTAANWREALGALGLSASPADPPPDMLQEIEARIDRYEDLASRTVRAADGEWRERTPGVWERILRDDPSSGARTYMLRCEPGAVVPAHGHRFDEEFYVLEGEIELEDLALAVGDFQRSPAGSSHSQSKTTNGCLLLVRLG